tara:strand:+ start:460 stop:933 length:474 start_codon:yes stop_codon:yes gene_type:complete
MKEGAAIMQNIVDKLEALVADTAHGNTQRFRHSRSTYEPRDLLDVRSPTRRFVVMPTGSRDLTGFLGQEGAMTSVQQTFDVAIAFAQGKNAHELYQRIVEDVDQIGRELMKTSNFDSVNTGLENRIVTSYSIEIGSQEGAAALVTIPVECRYTPTYA